MKKLINFIRIKYHIWQMDRFFYTDIAKCRYHNDQAMKLLRSR